MGILMEICVWKGRSAISILLSSIHFWVKSWVLCITSLYKECGHRCEYYFFFFSTTMRIPLGELLSFICSCISCIKYITSTSLFLNEKKNHVQGCCDNKWWQNYAKILIHGLQSLKDIILSSCLSSMSAFLDMVPGLCISWLYPLLFWEQSSICSMSSTLCSYRENGLLIWEFCPLVLVDFKFPVWKIKIRPNYKCNQIQPPIDLALSMALAPG